MWRPSGLVAKTDNNDDDDDDDEELPRVMMIATMLMVIKKAYMEKKKLFNFSKEWLQLHIANKFRAYSFQTKFS